MWVFQEIIDNGMPISAELYGCRAVRAKGILCGALFTSTVILNGFASCFVSNDNHNVCGVKVINNFVQQSYNFICFKANFKQRKCNYFCLKAHFLTFQMAKSWFWGKFSPFRPGIMQ